MRVPPATARIPAGPLAVGLGCSRLGSTLGGCDGKVALRLLQHALDAGVTLFDTADIYGQGESERLLGRALHGRRDGVTVVTKAGQRFTSAQRAAALVKRPLRQLSHLLPGLRRGIAARRAAPLPRDYSATHLSRAIEASLRRLGTGRIDLFLLHSPSAETITAGEGFATLDALRVTGALGAWGVSCDDAAAVRAALAVPAVAAVQLPLGVAVGLRPELAAAAARGVTLHLREVFSGISHAAGVHADLAAARRNALATALSFRGSAALVGTVRADHLDEALGIVRSLRALEAAT